MKKMLMLFLAVALLGTYSCQKEPAPTPSTDSGELQFSINQQSFTGDFKTTGDSVPECTDLSWDYVKFIIDGDTVKVDLITMVDGNINTQPYQLDVGAYIISSFIVYNDNGTPDEFDDVIVRAAPLPGSEYYELVENALELEITIEAFKKVNYIIDVLCYETLYYSQFGFVWFTLNDVVVNQICVFGDVCTTDTDLFSGSLYEGQENGLQMDMPAINEVWIYKGGVLQSVFSNEAWLGEGECLPVHWADDVDLFEEFYLVIKVLLPVGTGFDYVAIDSIPFTDTGSEFILHDGVLVFDVGNCSGNAGFFSYGCTAWTNLPTEEFTLTILNSGNTGGNPWIPASLGTKFTYEFAGIPAGYQVADGEWPGWCADKYNGIHLWTPYQATFVSSVLPLPMGFYLDQTQVNQLNWIFNHLNAYFPGIDVEDWLAYGAGFDANDWLQIQNAIWGITDGYGQISGSVAEQIYNDALANGGTYEPLPDEYGIVFCLINGEVQLQLILLYC